MADNGLWFVIQQIRLAVVSHSCPYDLGCVTSVNYTCFLPLG